MKKIFLQPGEVSFSELSAQITTIVGSCIAVCIYDQEHHWGGMCHYYLPKRPLGDLTNRNTDNHYGEYAIINLLKEFKRRGSNRRRLVAKVLGGGHVISVDLGENKDVGEGNIAIAEEILGKMSIPIVGKAIGGAQGKKIIYDTETGEIRFQNIVSSTHLKEHHLIKVLIVEDSKPIRKILATMIGRDPIFKVIGEAEHPEEAKKIIATTKPDVITLDIKMPIMDGVTFLKQYMPVNPIPTVIVSGLSDSDSKDIIDALENGAFDYIRKPSFNDIEGLTFDLHNVLKAAHESRLHLRGVQKALHTTDVATVTLPAAKCENALVLLGASTGGTEALKSVLTKLPGQIPPILIVQHIPPVFSTQFANRMDELCPFKVQEARDGVIAEPNNVYIAPGGRHLRVNATGSFLRLQVTDDPPVNRFKPSVDYLFESAQKVSGRKLVAALLTGMGADGAEGLLKLKARGAHTIAQDEASSIVYGMPKAAKELNATKEILPLNEIARAIIKALL